MTLVIPERLDGEARPEWLDNPQYKSNNVVHPVVEFDKYWTKQPVRHFPYYRDETELVFRVDEQEMLSEKEALASAQRETHAYLTEVAINEALAEMEIGPASSGIAFVHVLRGMKLVAAKLGGEV